jgi:glucuronoarabinoxylan endo-1,4-beta-xylanase
MKKLFFLFTLALFLACMPPNGQTITINWTTPLQIIDGFGAASAAVVPPLTSAQMNFLYTTSGIGLDFIRLQIYPNSVDCADDITASNCVTVSSGATLGNDDLANARAAYARGARVWATEWSPPDAMKSSGSFLGGGSMIGNSTNYTTLASIQAGFVTLLTGTYGIPVYAISVQNEPNVSRNYASCTWTAQQFHDYVPYLYSALSTAGYPPSTKIMISEASSWKNSYDATAMADSSVAPDIGILAEHGYRSSASLLTWSNFATQWVWETEVSDFNTYDGSMTSALTYATQIYQWLTKAQVNAWNYWLLTGQAWGGTKGFSDNEALTDVNGNVAMRAYALGNWAKFVRPGWHMVSVTNSTGLLVTAFADSLNHNAAIVVVNTSGSAVTNQAISVGTAMGSSVVPWVTSSSLSLAAQSSVSVSSGSFTYTFPADSVVTFQGQSLGGAKARLQGHQGV